MPDFGNGDNRNRRTGSTREGSSSSFAARFGRVILQHGIAAIPAGLYHYQGKLELDAKHLWFVSYILSCKWDADLPYPSLNKMERCTGVEIQALYRYKKALCNQGYLKVFKRMTPQGGFDTNAYDFSALFDRLEAFIAADQPPPNAIRADGPAPSHEELDEQDSSFVARYGRVIARYGVAAIPRAVFTHQKALGLTPQQVWFVSYILSFKWDTSLPYPSVEKMAQNTGYSRAYLHEIKSSLVDAGYLRLVHRINEQGGQDTNAYDFSGLLDAIRAQLQGEAKDAGSQPTGHEEQPQPSIEDSHPRAQRRGRAAAQARSMSKELDGENDRDAEGLIQHTWVGINRQIAPGVTEKTDPSLTQHTRVYVGKQTEAGIEGNTPPVKGTKLTHVARGRQGKVAAGGHKTETNNTEAKDKDDSNHLDQISDMIQKTSNASIPGYSPYIAGVVSDFSRELDDVSHEASNMSQALRLWREWGISEQEFVELMHEAKRLTRKYQARPHWDAMNNKMAYYFTVLRRLLAGETNLS